MTLALKPSNDRKVSTLVRITPSGEQKPSHPNAFGLPAGITCPGRTPFCDSCYAVGIERFRHDTARLVHHNLEILLACGDNVHAMVNALDGVVSQSYTRGSRVYRIHWDGDFYSLPYAQAWATVVRAYPDVQFYVYTRSFDTLTLDVLPALVGIANLSVYLSVDEYNLAAAHDALERYVGELHVAACAETQEQAQLLIEKLERRKAPACPENVKRLPLVVAMDGRRSTPLTPGMEAQGACAACRMCVDGVADVRFAIAKR